MIKGITACSIEQAKEYNSMNDKEINSNSMRHKTISKIKARDYSGCKITKVS